MRSRRDLTTGRTGWTFREGLKRRDVRRVTRMRERAPGGKERRRGAAPKPQRPEGAPGASVFDGQEEPDHDRDEEAKGVRVADDRRQAGASQLRQDEDRVGRGVGQQQELE